MGTLTIILALVMVFLGISLMALGILLIDQIRKMVSSQTRRQIRTEIAETLKKDTRLAKKVKLIFILMYGTFTATFLCLVVGWLSYQFNSLFMISLNSDTSVLVLWSFTGIFSVLVIIESIIEQWGARLLAPLVTQIKPPKKVNIKRRHFFSRLLLIAGAIVLTAWFQMTF
ncbi:hypothetical protein ACNAN0_02095 [Agrilactobacillus fermenti]|uniref:hypothetical protein n=1 Tax=Agrilactobacillus fermenti TaxID=2586909 RepID=UPI003A5C208F